MQYFRRSGEGSFMDCKFNFDEGPEKPLTSAVFGPDYMASKLYAGCPSEASSLFHFPCTLFLAIFISIAPNIILVLSVTRMNKNVP